MHVHVAVFDTRLGQSEDNPNEAVLAYWPGTEKIGDKEAGYVRIARGTMGMCSNFDEDHDCDFVEMRFNSLVLLQAEPHIYWMLVVPNLSGNLELLHEPATRFLRRIHGLYILLFQRVQASLDMGGAAVATPRLLAFLGDFMPAAIQGAGWCTVRDLYTPLTPYSGLPLLQAPSPMDVGLQCMAASMAVTPSVSGDRATLGVMVLVKSFLLLSTLNEADSSALYLLASHTIVPVTRVANKATEISKLYHTAKGSVKAAASPSAHSDVLAPALWKLSKEGSTAGFIVCDRAMGEAGASGGSNGVGALALTTPAGCPLLHLQGGREPCRMLVWHQEGLQVVVLVKGDAAVSLADLASTRRDITRYMADLDRCAVDNWTFVEHGRLAAGHLTSQRLASAAEGKKKGHIKGARYAFVNHTGPFSSSTPVAKLSTCSTTSLGVMSVLWQDCVAHLRTEMQRQKDVRTKMMFPEDPAMEGRARRLPVSSPPAGAVNMAPRGTLHDKAESLSLASMSLEALALGPSGKWVAAQWNTGCEMLNVVDAVADGEDSLLQINAELRHFATTNFPGALGP